MCSIVGDDFLVFDELFEALLRRFPVRLDHQLIYRGCVYNCWSVQSPDIRISEILEKWSGKAHEDLVLDCRQCLHLFLHLVYLHFDRHKLA